jgi:hypothetical protein
MWSSTAGRTRGRTRMASDVELRCSSGKSDTTSRPPRWRLKLPAACEALAVEGRPTLPRRRQLATVEPRLDGSSSVEARESVRGALALRLSRSNGYIRKRVA